MPYSHRIACYLIFITFIPVSRTSAQPDGSGGLLQGDAATDDASVLVPLDRELRQNNAGLFVGVNEFKDKDHLSELRFAVHDAIELAYLFVVELKLIPAKNCVVAISGEPTAESIKQHRQILVDLGVEVTGAEKSTILQALDAITRIPTRQTDILLVSFGSHGFDQERTAYVVPSDGLRNDLAETALRLPSIELRMEEAKKAGHRLLLVDACQERISSETRGSRSPRGSGMSKAFEAALQRTSGQGKFASCSSGQFSHEGSTLGGVGHGLFTYAFLEALRGKAHPDKDNLIQLDAVIKYVNRRVQQWIDDQNRRRPADAPLQAQSPSWHGPEEIRQMPLAQRGDELTTLLAKLKNRIDPATGFSADLYERLVLHLSSRDLADSENRQLMVHARDFSLGQLSAELFVPYLKPRVAAVPAALAWPFTAGEASKGQQSWAKHISQEPIVTNSIGMKFVLVPPGEFLMGSPASEDGRYDDEYQHRVRITQPFYLGVCEVTQAEYGEVSKDNASWFTDSGGGRAAVQDVDTSKFPVENVSWHQANDFCKRLTEQSEEQASGRSYRLPTEAEWEFASRGVGSDFDFEQLARHAWFLDNAKRRANRTGGLAANGFGLHDMLGNVSEWCDDWYQRGYYRQSPDADPHGPSEGESDGRKVLRGGSWVSSSRLCRPAYRGASRPDARNSTDGFRVVLEIGGPNRE